MKALKYILSGVIWTLLGLYLVVTLVFEVPAVKEWAGAKMAGAVAQKLGTSVSIETADFGIPNHLTLNNVVIRDKQGEAMLLARRLAARIDLLPLLEGRISIATAQILGAHAKLYRRDSLSQPNYQFALDSLASKDTTSQSAIDLRINSLIMRHCSVSWDRMDKPTTPETLNPDHLALTDIDTHIILKRMTRDTMNIAIRRLAFKEKAGLEVERLALKFEGGHTHSTLKGLELKMPNTHLRMGDIEARYLLRNEKVVIPSLRFNGSIEESTITLSDLRSLLPGLKQFDETLTLSTNLHGEGDNITLENLHVSSTADDVSIDIDGWIRGLSEPEPTWQANVNHLILSAKTINFVTENLKGQKTELPAIMTRLGRVDVKGIFKGTGTSEIGIQSRLVADIGSITAALGMDKQHAFHGEISTDGINIGRLLEDKQLGTVATNINIEGRLPSHGDIVVNAKGTVNRFEYNGYTYRNARVNGSYSPLFINGQLAIDDPNIKLDIEGNVEKQARTNIVNIKAAVSELSPKAINLTDKWDDARFAANINANFTASSLNDAVGQIDVTDLTMAAPDRGYHMKAMHIASGYEAETHYLTLSSDFADIGIKGNFDYQTLAQSITNVLAKALPTLPGLPAVNPNTHNNFSVSARITKSDWIEDILQMPVQLNKPVTLAGIVNDQTEDIVMECDMPDFTWDDSRYRRGHFSMSSPNDSLRYDMRITKIYDDGEPMDLRIFGKAADNNLHTSLRWDNHQQETVMSGQLNAVANFEMGPNGKQTANINIQPSTINIHNSDWHIQPAHITYSDKYIDIRDFAVSHEQQHIIINGTASESNQDSVFVDLIDVDIAYILQLVDFDAVAFNGLASGTCNLRGLFGNIEADARLGIQQFEFEHGRMGTLTANVDWNKEAEQIDIHATADDGDDAKTYIEGYVSPARNYIDLGIRADGTYLDFAKSFTASFIDHIDGHGKGQVRLIGPLDAINLTGELVLNGIAHVTTLGCTYEMRNDTIRMVPNEIEFTHCPIYDINDNEAMLTGGIHHKCLTNMTYDIYVEADKLMAYDFPDFGENTFYGTVYVNGKAAIHGLDNETIIEADVTPLENSLYVYNASSPEVTASQEFIEWGDLHPTGTKKKNTSEEDDYVSDLTMRLKINATRDATVRLLMDARTGDYITVHGHGDLQCTYYNKGGFTMFGNYEIDDGTYNITIQNVIRKVFTFTQGGTVVFAGDPYDAQLNLQAQHTVNGVSLSDLNVGSTFSSTVRVNCLMNISGQPSAPIVDFDFDILNVNAEEEQIVKSVINGQEEMKQQVVYLLAIGRFYPQGANNASQNDSQRSNTSLAMQSLLSGTLSGQLNSMLGQVIKSNNWNFGANISTGDEGWNNAEYEGIINGRLLNNRLLINGQFGYRDNVKTATPSFIGDFDVRYLLMPNGNIALKVYNQTNDRYFTKSSLNTQGIGIILKKDFNGWHDLFHRERKNTKK